MMIPFFRHHTGARTAWKGQDIVVYVDGVETDRINAAEIERVVLVHRSDGNTPGDLEVALIQLSNEVVALSADTGIAGRILFERLAFWNERACIYWVSSRSVALPRALRRCRGGLLGSGVPIARVASADAVAALDSWPLAGPQTWEERKQMRIERARPFSRANMAAAMSTAHAGH
jgi:hypothetical protein